MALTAPTPPVGAPRSGTADIAGMISMMGGAAGAKEVQNEQFIGKLRPALKLLADLEDHLTKHPEITPVVQSIMQAKFNMKNTARSRNRGPAPNMPLAMPPAGGAQPVPSTMGAGSAPPPPPAVPQRPF